MVAVAVAVKEVLLFLVVLLGELLLEWEKKLLVVSDVELVAWDSGCIGCCCFCCCCRRSFLVPPSVSMLWLSILARLPLGRSNTRCFFFLSILFVAVAAEAITKVGELKDVPMSLLRSLDSRLATLVVGDSGGDPCCWYCCCCCFLEVLLWLVLVLIVNDSGG